jgi:hypothetical protein
MGFMDKIKEASQNVAAEAKKATAQGKEKLGDMQAKKKMDEAAKKIGYLIYREKTEGTAAGSEVDTLVAEMRTHQQTIDEESTPAAAAPEAAGTATPPAVTPPAAPQEPTSSEPAPGDFKL